MGIKTLIVLAAALSGVVDRPVTKKNVPRDEAKLLQGSWRVVSLESRGRQFPEVRIRQLDYKLVIQGNTFTFMLRGRQTVTHFKLDPTSKPKAIDLVGADGPQKGRVRLGVYQLDGDTLKICQAFPGANRPTAFTTQGDTRQNIMVLKREKP